MLHILALSQSAVTVRHWFEINLDDASMEHGARIELRQLRQEPHRGSESASQLVTVDRTLWRADLFDRLTDDSGSFAAAHYHPEFSNNEPCDRVWDSGLTADPWNWLGDQFTNLGAGAGTDAWRIDPEDGEQLRSMANTIVITAKQFSPASCTSAFECYRLTRDVRNAVNLMIRTLRAPSLLDRNWVSPWLQP